MPKKYPVLVRRFVLKLLHKHRKPNQNQYALDSVVQFTGVSKTTIKRWKTNGVADKPRSRTVPTLKEIAGPFIEEMVSSSCVWTHATMCKELANDLNKGSSQHPLKPLSPIKSIVVLLSLRRGQRMFSTVSSVVLASDTFAP
jgi:hypothetical protein